MQGTDGGGLPTTPKKKRQQGAQRGAQQGMDGCMDGDDSLKRQKRAQGVARWAQIGPGS